MTVLKTFASTADANSVFVFFLIISVILLVLITSLMLFFVVRYNRKKNTRPENIAGNIPLEIVWTVIPTILVLIMFYYGWAGFKNMQGPKKNALIVRVIGQQWVWLFEYENGKKSDVLNLPVKKPVELVITSKDVIHSFFIPTFRLKKDAVPGMKTRLFFIPKQEGNFDAFCAEYCGQGHSSMRARVVVMKEKEFQEWYEAKETHAEGKEGAEKKSIEKGMELIKLKGCIGCHTVDGTPRIGPTLKGVYRKKVVVITGGKEREITADEAYLKRSIEDPKADIVKGFQPIMPPQNLSEEELSSIIEYLEHLK